MKNMIALLACLASFSALADISLEITKTSNLSLSGLGIYQTTKKSFFCTEGSFADGSYERHPKISEKNIEIKASGSVSLVNVLESLGDNCKSELNNMMIIVNHPLISVHSKRLEVHSTDVDMDQEVQKISYRKISSPNGDFYATDSTKILVGHNGAARVEISLVE